MLQVKFVLDDFPRALSAAAELDTRIRSSGENTNDVMTSNDAMPSPAFSRGSSLDRESSLGPEGNASKILKIRRFVCFQNWTCNLLSFTG